jgi:hypothetical protein
VISQKKPLERRHKGALKMPKSEELKTDEDHEPQAADPDRPSENAAVSRCIRAWRRAQKSASANGLSEYKSGCAGNIAYLRAVPPLDGYENIRGFIACIAFAVMTEVIRQKDSEYLLAAAKVALGTLRFDLKSVDSVPRMPGRPRKTIPTEENK